MYWTEIGSIKRANIDGSNFQELIISPASPKQIVADSGNGDTIMKKLDLETGTVTSLHYDFDLSREGLDDTGHFARYIFVS